MKIIDSKIHENVYNTCGICAAAIFKQLESRILKKDVEGELVNEKLIKIKENDFFGLFMKSEGEYVVIHILEKLKSNGFIELISSDNWKPDNETIGRVLKWGYGMKDLSKLINEYLVSCQDSKTFPNNKDFERYTKGTKRTKEFMIQQHINHPPESDEYPEDKEFVEKFWRVFVENKINNNLKPLKKDFIEYVNYKYKRMKSGM